MFPKIKSPYWRAAFWIAVLVLAALAAIYPSTKDTFMTEGHGALYYAGYSVLFPGAFVGAEIASLMLHFSHDRAESIEIGLNGLFWLRYAAPIFSWMIYFALVSLIVKTRRSRAARGV